MVRVALLDPENSCGAKTTSTLQLPPAGTTRPTQVFCALKSVASAPPSATPLTLRSAPPVLLIVTVWTALSVPSRWLGNVSEEGPKVTAGAVLASAPEPVSAILSGVRKLPLWLTSTVAVRACATVGENVTLTMHVASRLSDLPTHVPPGASWKSPGFPLVASSATLLTVMLLV